MSCQHLDAALHLSRARKAIRTVIEGFRDDKQLRFLEFPNQVHADAARSTSHMLNADLPQWA